MLCVTAITMFADNMKAIITLILIGLSVVGISFLIIGLRVLYLSGEPRRWLDSHGNDAEIYAAAVLNGEELPIPATLTNFHIETSRRYVSFCEPTGPLYSKGMAYSLDGSIPPMGLGGEPRVTSWKHIKGNWYSWTAD